MFNCIWRVARVVNGAVCYTVIEQSVHWFESNTLRQNKLGYVEKFSYICIRSLKYAPFV